MSVPTELRARIAADYGAVTPLQSPFVRALWVAPFAALALVAAPMYLSVRSDVDQLGWATGWGASLLEVALGFIVIAAALRESVPGRAWNRVALIAWVVVPIAVMIAVAAVTRQASHIALRGNILMFGAVCLGGSAATALPVVALANVLAARAYPTRPAIVGLLLGLGGGLMADAGWRMFCHVTDPSHVLPAHAGGVAVAALAGAALAVTLRKPFR